MAPLRQSERELRRHLEAMLARVKTLVVLDVLDSSTAAKYAKVRLPATMHWEQNRRAPASTRAGSEYSAVFRVTLSAPAWSKRAIPSRCIASRPTTGCGGFSAPGG